MSHISNSITVSLLALSFLGCGPEEDEFSKKVFFCDNSNAKPGCGSTSEGAPMTCFGGKQLGAARDFCVEQCTAEADFSDASGAVCATSSAKLRTCRPSEKSAEDPDGCGPDLACYRTDLFRDEGVCLAIRVCSTDTDCPDKVLSTCAGSVFKKLLPALPLETSNLQCVLAGCKARGASCPPNETCLPLVAPAIYELPDICVPHCDSNLNCPPNYYCMRRASGPHAPNVCLPGMQSLRCNSSLDCMIGDCLDTNLGFKLCGVPCQGHEDCVPYGDTYNKLLCVSHDGGEKRHCLAPPSFTGSACLSDGDCFLPNQKCFFSNPYRSGGLGECRLPCDADGRCAVRGGFAHTCFIRGDERSCYPGRFSLPCQRNEDCVSGVTCETVPPEPRFAGTDAPSASETRICTVRCQKDEDCLAFPGASDESYCEAGFCRLGGGEGSPCTEERHCRFTARCVRADGGASSACTYN